MDLSKNIYSRIEEKSSNFEKIINLISDELRKVDQEFRKNLRSDVSIIPVIGEHLLRSGGKRIRPILLLLSSRLFGYKGNAHITLASLIEFIHTATLLHDDVVDRAELRRGIESANSKWGNEACVLVGDFLFTKGFSVLVEIGNQRILQAVAKATTMMAEGEIEELVKTNDLSTTEGEYISIVARKTASLFSVATQIGAILGKAPQEEEKALIDFGIDLGIAFQIIDDNLDYTSREEEFGKKIGIDLQDGKITLPLIYTLSQCNAEERDIIHKTTKSESINKDEFFEVVKIIERYQGLKYTYQKAKEYVEMAKSRLNIFPNSIERSAFNLLADYVLERRI